MLAYMLKLQNHKIKRNSNVCRRQKNASEARIKKNDLQKIYTRLDLAFLYPFEIYIRYKVAHNISCKSNIDVKACQVHASMHK